MDLTPLLTECTYQTSPSGGPGGQHANKVETQVTLRFAVRASRILSLAQQDLICARLASRLTQGGELLLHAREARAQRANKEAVQARFLRLIAHALVPVRPRRPTRPPRQANAQRLQAKKRRSEKKQWRRPPE